MTDCKPGQRLRWAAHVTADDLKSKLYIDRGRHSLGMKFVRLISPGRIIVHFDGLAGREYWVYIDMVEPVFVCPKRKVVDNRARV